MSQPISHIAFVGFSEAGQHFGRDLREQASLEITAYDLRFAGPNGGGLRDAATELGVGLTNSIAEAIAGADLIISAVTAEAATTVAEQTGRSIASDQFFLDINSVSPGTKQLAARSISEAGGRFVEAAVMSPIPPHGVSVPMAIGGPHANALAVLLRPLGFNLDVVSDEVGFASAIKMCRSIMIKGMEALMVECMVAALAHGVDKHVIDSLDATLPGINWADRAGYVISRVVKHGARRAQEAHQAAAMVAEIGVDPHMANAIAACQQWVADLEIDVADECQDYVALADRIRRAI